jgi:hypothetical protein
MAVANRGPLADLPDGIEYLGAAIALELVLTALYFLGTPVSFSTLRYVLYPFVWINVALWAAFKMPVPSLRLRDHVVAAGVAAAYFFLLANFAGLVGLTEAGHHAVPTGITVGSGSLGWSRVRVITELVYVSFIPYRVIGYVGLAYLVYAAVLDATSAAISGALGIVSCLSCSFPIFASFATALFGGSFTLMTTVYAYSIDIATVVFVLSVVLLYWRPGFPSVGD